MTTPSGYPTQIVRGSYVHLPGSKALSGTVTLEAVIAPNSVLTCPSAGVIIHPRWSQELDFEGKISMHVPPTDHPDILPHPFSYLYTFESFDGRRTSKHIEVPTNGGPVDLLTAAEVAPVAVRHHVLTVDDVGVLVAPLVGGQVPVEHLPELHDAPIIYGYGPPASDVGYPGASYIDQSDPYTLYRSY